MTASRTAEPQRLRALERANEIRLERAALKRRIAAGEVSAAEVILNPPQSAETWSVGDLLMSQRRWGTTRCRRFLARNSITETKHVGTLTERQKRLLAVVEALPESDQSCLRLRAEGLRYREIAAVLRISLGAVSISLTQSLARLIRADGR